MDSQAVPKTAEKGHLAAETRSQILTGRKDHRYTLAPMARRTDQRNGWAGIGTGWSITATMIAGVAVWGGIGYLIDLAAGTPHVFAAAGGILGAAGATYIVYLRYGREDRADS